MRRYIVIFIIFFTFFITVSSAFSQMTIEEKRNNKRVTRNLLKEIIASIDEEKYSEGLILLDSLLTLDPKNTDGFYFKGLTLTKTNDTATALLTLEDGIAKTPLSSRLKVLISRIYINQGEFDKALAHLESILKIKPNEEETLYLSGVIYLQKADTTQALELFEKALQHSLSGK